MHLSIRKYKTSAPAEVTRKVKKGFIPIISQAAGFVAYYAIDAGEGQWASVSVFETKAGAEKSTRLAAEWAKENVGPLLAGAPDVTAGKVIAHAKA
jgi:hypothetical protein